MKYMADDGKVFTTAKECKDYEVTLKNSDVIGYDSDYNPVYISDPDFFDKIVVVNLKTDEVVKLFKEKAKKNCSPTNGIDSPGVYISEYVNVFTGNSISLYEKWHHLNAVLNDCTKLLEIVKKYIEII